MQKRREKHKQAGAERIKLGSARVSLTAYDAISEIQRQHRRKTGRHLPLWKILDAAVISYAKRLGIRVGKSSKP